MQAGCSKSTNQFDRKKYIVVSERASLFQKSVANIERIFSSAKEIKKISYKISATTKVLPPTKIKSLLPALCFAVLNALLTDG